MTEVEVEVEAVRDNPLKKLRQESERRDLGGKSV